MNRKLPLTICFLLAVVASSAFVFGGEPPATRTLIEKARMATHVVVGSLESVQVIERATGTAIASPADTLEEGQCFEALLLVGEVIANDQAHPLRVGGRAKIRFGGRRSTLSVTKEALIGRPLIYWLSQDQEITRRDNFFFPFYGETALCELPNRKDEVVAVIGRIANGLK